MSEDNNSSGIFGSIISLLVLAVIWPYLLALLALFIAYQIAVAVLEWMAQNPLTVVFILLGVLAVYAVFHYRLIPRAWHWLNNKIIGEVSPKALPVQLIQDAQILDMPDLAKRKFIPSTNLYCYWCTKKLGRNAWERSGKYYCTACSEKLIQRH